MTEDEKLIKAITTGAKIMVDNGLGDWTVKLHGKRKVLADCSINRKTIRYSKHFIKVATEEEFVGVTYHEVTHALLPKNVHHGKEFVELCNKLSPNSKYAKRSVSIPLYKYRLVCPECSAVCYSNVNKNWICGKCSRQGKKIKLDIKEHIQKVTVW